MAPSLNSVSIPTALPASCKLDLSCDHVTTMDFGKMQPIHYRHNIKGESLTFAGTGTIRPFPLATATYGRMRLNIHNFFVPWRVVFPQWDSQYNDTIAVNASNASLIDDAPSFQNDTIYDMFTGAGNPFAEEIIQGSDFDPSTVVYDFRTGTVGSYKYFRFTSFGKDCYKILCAFGYQINWDKQDDVKYSLLPLLAYAKVYIDYFANQSYLDSQDVISIRKMLAYNDPVTPLVASASQLTALLYLCQFVTYDQDYFTGAWDNPFAPVSGQYSAITFSDIVNQAGGGAIGTASVTNNSVGGLGFGTPVMRQAAAANTSLGSQYLHDALKVITDYSKRHQLAGASNIARTLAQYGFGVEAMKFDRSYYIDGVSIDVKTGAVFSTANTAGAGDPSTLGDFAGNGYGNGVSNYNMRIQEAGISISIASIMPSGGYFQGTDENNMHVKKRDFYTPEFDSLGVQALRKREVYVSNNGDFGYNLDNDIDYDNAFGVTGRYAEYKRPRSWVSGDLRVPTRYQGGDSWHLMRQFTDDSFVSGIDGLFHSLAFTRCLDFESYHRIFTMTNSDNDPFVAEFHFDVHANAPCHGLFEGYEFDTQGNKEVTVQSGGGILN